MWREGPGRPRPAVGEGLATHEVRRRLPEVGQLAHEFLKMACCFRCNFEEVSVFAGNPLTFEDLGTLLDL